MPRFFAIDDNIMYQAETDIITGEFLWSKIFQEYPTKEDLMKDLKSQGLPYDPVYWHPEQFGLKISDLADPVYIDRGEKRAYQSGRASPSSNPSF